MQASLTLRNRRIQCLESLIIFQPRRALSQTTRFVHQSPQRNAALPTPLPISPSQEAPPPPAPSRRPRRQGGASTKTVLGRLPTSTLVRSYLIMAMSSSPVLLSLCFGVLRRMLASKSYLMSLERNPVLAAILKHTFYAQFCVGERKDEVVQNTEFARSVLGYDGIQFEYALEVLGGGQVPTAEETAKEIATWREGMLQSVDMAKPGDFIGLKWSGLGRHALHLLQTQQDATPDMWAAITAACDAAAVKGVCLLPGAEEEATNLGLESWTLALQKKYNAPDKGRALLYITYQCYLRGITRRLAHHLETASREGYIAGVKLVRGAYLTSEPKQLTFDTKEATDANYDACAEAVVRQEWNEQVAAPSSALPFPSVNIIVATHNLVSIQKVKKIRDSQMLSATPESLPRLAYTQLQGMADEISQSLVQDEGITADTQAKVVKCSTWGTTTQCLNYLLRRASENKEAATRTKDTKQAMGVELGRRMKSVVFPWAPWGAQG